MVLSHKYLDFKANCLRMAMQFHFLAPHAEHQVCVWSLCSLLLCVDTVIVLLTLLPLGLLDIWAERVQRCFHTIPTDWGSLGGDWSVWVSCTSSQPW